MSYECSSCPACLIAHLPKEGQFGRQDSWITHNLQLYVYFELESEVMWDMGWDSRTGAELLSAELERREDRGQAALKRLVVLAH